MEIDRLFVSSGGAEIRVVGDEGCVQMKSDFPYVYSAKSLNELARFLLEVSEDMREEQDR